VRKAVHEVRRHTVEYLIGKGCKPDEIRIELAREAKMGKVDADRQLFKNRLRNRIRIEIADQFNLTSGSSSHRRAAENRVILAVQQDCICSLCGKRMFNNECNGITLRTAALGQGCELAHIVPKGCGGHNGLGNLVLAHTQCNRNMGRRTPRAYWDADLKGGFDEGISWIESIYGKIARIKPSDTKKATGIELWKCYLTEQARPKRGSMSALPPNFFTNRSDLAKIEQFKKDVTDIQGMTRGQLAATTYATRQVMSYLADALFDGKGLPERSGGMDAANASGEEDCTRRIYTTDGIWTGRIRREWRLFFDPHDFRAKGLTTQQERERKEKDRGDHREHAIDAVAVALCTEQLKKGWEAREKQADKDGIKTADEEAMENYRRLHPLPLPAPFSSRDELHKAVRRAVFGDGEIERPICHRPVKRKLIGAFHKGTQYGPTFDSWVQSGIVHSELVKERVTVRQQVLGEAKSDFLKPSHLRLPRPETDDEAIERLARRLRVGKRALSSEEARKVARKTVKSKAFVRMKTEPKPEKGGIVRDTGLKRLLRRRLDERGLNPDSYTKSELKKSIDVHGPLTHDSGVPIHSVVLLWSNRDPVTIQRVQHDYVSGKRKKSGDARMLRLYDGQNNHHIEIRVKKNKSGDDVWSGEVVTMFEAAQQKLNRLRAYNRAGIPNQKKLRKLPETERRSFRKELSRIDETHPLVDRSDNEEKGGSFVMSLCEGEMLLMKHKQTHEVGYFVVAKLDKPRRSIVVVPHWDARSATERKDSEGKKVPDSQRDQFAITPTDLKQLAPPGHPHAAKVRVTPLGETIVLSKD
jgi:5-methylcytosine-specific restriction endonuclease McrA